jgi:uncharacterized membrane protein
MRTLGLTKGAFIASAVASLIATTGCGSDDEKDNAGTDAQQIRCLGGNECAAMSECAGGPGGSECAGMNECMGQGWVYTDSAEECTELGGMPEA